MTGGASQDIVLLDIRAHVRLHVPVPFTQRAASIDQAERTIVEQCRDPLPCRRARVTV